MPTVISTSVTVDDTRAYVYPADTAYIMDDGSDRILYSLDLAPRKDG